LFDQLAVGTVTEIHYENISTFLAVPRNPTGKTKQAPIKNMVRLLSSLSDI